MKREGGNVKLKRKCDGVELVIAGDWESVPDEPVERWERVVGGTVQMSAYGQRLNVYVDEKRLYSFPLPSGYRWAWDKQEDGTLVIERKVTE